MGDITSEADFQGRLLIALGSVRGLRVWRQNAGTAVLMDPVTCQRRAFKGAPTGAADISGIAMGGLRVEIECKKSRKEKPTREQCQWRDLIVSYGGCYVLVHGDMAIPEAVSLVTDSIARARRF